MLGNCLFVAVLLVATASVQSVSDSRTVCYYDSRSFVQEGLGKVTLTDLEAGLSMCTHLVYGYAGINAETKKVVSLNPSQDLDQGKGLYRLTTQLKRKYPGLKVLLGVGGDAENAPEKYMECLETSPSRISFINSAYELIKSYEFDGLDLAFEFPKIKPKKIRSSVGSVWHSFKKTIGVAGNAVDPKSDEHKEEFTALVREIKNSFRHDGYLLSVTILPNVNSTLYLDVPAIVSYVDWFTIAAFDQQTPARNKDETDFPAPLYKLTDRNPELNVDYQVTDLLGRSAPGSKIVIGIPTYGRVWQLEEGKTSTGVPPVEADGPAAAGLQSKKEGLMSYPEICAKLPNPSNKDMKGENAPIRKVGDPTKRYGTYAYRIPDSDGKNGLWIGYEDPDTAGNKAAYVRAKNLGGVAIFDLSLDDFRGTCSPEKFPILRSAHARLV
ncbi:unnamed protein product [Diamesa serratosioi]